MSQPPQAKVSADAPGLETGLSCVYNATRGCRLNSKVTIADSAREPLKVLKVLIEGLARDGESSLWLTPLTFTPSLMRLFPFDFAYLDRDLRVIEGLALPPGVPLPKFSPQVASALILPLDTFSTTGTCAGDRLIVCAEEELEARIAEISTAAVVAATATVLADTPVTPIETQLPEVLRATPAPVPVQAPQSPQPFFAGLTGQSGRGTVSTLTMATGWQISNSTTAAVLPDPAQSRAAQAPEEEAAITDLALPGTAVVLTITEGLPDEPDTANHQDADSAPLQSESFADPSPAVSPESNLSHQASPQASPPVEGPPEALSALPSQAAPAVEQAKPQAGSPATRIAAVQPQRKGDIATPVAPARAGKPDAEKATKASDEKKKDSFGVLVKRFLNCEDPLPERRSIIRLLSKELVAYLAKGEKTEALEVRDVSPSGLYLLTQERWKPGQVISIVLQRKAAKDEDHEGRVTVRVRVVRCDDDGIGLSWMWPEGIEFQPWNRLHTKRSDETDAVYFLRELRLTAALGFLRQICPSAVEEIKLALHQRLSNKRVASAVQIALKAQASLADREHREDKLAHSDMVRRILENGSWTEDIWIRQWWAGLLTSSCSPDGLDSSNTVFIDLLAKLTPVHLRVLSFVCRKDAELPTAGDPATKRDIDCTADELIAAVGSHSLARIQQTMGQLSSLALLNESSNPSYVSVTDKGKTRIAPTTLGLKMYARCHGHR